MAVLWRIRRVDDDGVLGLVIRHEVGVIIARSLPYVMVNSLFSYLAVGALTHRD